MLSSSSPQNTIQIGLHLIANSIEDASEKTMIARWRREHEQFHAKRARRQKILDAIREGYDILTEIAAATGIPSATARRILIELVSRKLVSVTRTNNTNNRYKGVIFRYELVA